MSKSQLSFLNLLCLPAGQHQAKHDEGGACLKLSVVSTHGNALGYSLKYPNANQLSLILSPTKKVLYSSNLALGLHLQDQICI